LVVSLMGPSHKIGRPTIPTLSSWELVVSLMGHSHKIGRPTIPILSSKVYDASNGQWDTL